VLWGDDGKPLCLVEAKRAQRDPRVGQQQAKLYADFLEKGFGRYKKNPGNQGSGAKSGVAGQGAGRNVKARAYQSSNGIR
jgi:type I site-specific restriction endonuclease